MVFFGKGIVPVVLRVRDVVIEEVEENKDTNHVSDVEVAGNGKGEEDNENFVSSVFYKLLDTVYNERKPHHRIHPHRVAVMNEGVCAHRIKNRECYNRQFVSVD